MQGTIKNYDPVTRSGSLLTDDRTEISIDAGSATPQVRSLRIGQRVRFEVDQQVAPAVARRLRLVTFE